MRRRPSSSRVTASRTASQNAGQADGGNTENTYAFPERPAQETNRDASEVCDSAAKPLAARSERPAAGASHGSGEGSQSPVTSTPTA
jgi:hypothetical protein